MDTIRTGKFIAQIRKEMNMTQRQLADELFISDKTVSKWETGKGMPDVSLMQPLCETLGISVNELLSGERLSDENYKERAEENMVDLMEKHSNIKRFVSAIAATLATGVAVGLIIAVIFFGGLETRFRIMLAAAAVITMTVGLILSFSADRRSGYFECTKCHTVFTPSMGTYVKGSITVTPFSARFVCPECKKVTLCKRRFTRNGGRK